MPWFAEPEKRATGGVAICPSGLWPLNGGLTIYTETVSASALLVWAVAESKWLLQLERKPRDDRTVG
jgi:hypothetical protein